MHKTFRTVYINVERPTNAGGGWGQRYGFDSHLKEGNGESSKTISGFAFTNTERAVYTNTL